MIRFKFYYFVECDGCGRVDQEGYAKTGDLKLDKSDSGWVFGEQISCPQCVQESKECLLCKEVVDS